MRNVVLISCVSQKLETEAKAKDLYTSPLFRKNMAYAHKLQPDNIYILSAKYGLLGLDEKIKPYDLTLNTMKTSEKKEWAAFVLEQIRKKVDMNSTNFIFLAGKNYRQYLIPYMPHFDIPMEGMRIGEQLQFLTEKLQ